MEILTVTINLAGKTHKLKVEQDSEQHIRQAALMINERMEYHLNRAKMDEQEALSFTALDSVTGLMYANRDEERSKVRLFERLERLEKSITI